MDPKVVLVADADPHTCLLISEVLGSAGYRVVTAPVNLAGLRTMGLQRPDIVLLGAPPLTPTSRDTLQAIHDRYPGTPTVLLAAPTDVAEEREWHDSDRIITKPINPTALIAVVRGLAPL